VRRSRATLTLYASLACLGYLLNGLGVVLPQLRDELGLSRVEVATYPSAFALGLLGVGVAGERATRALGRRALPAALAAGGAGALLLASGVDRALSAAGALLLGVGGAGLVQLVPADLRAEHGRLAAVAIGEANATASAASVLAPLLVAIGLRAGLGWRAGYLVLPLAGIALLLASLRRAVPAATADGRAGREHPNPSQPAPAAFLGHWLDVLLVVSVEFCLIFWAADYLHSQRGVPSDAAATGAALFLLGMAAGRAAAMPVTRLLPVPARLLAAAAVLAGAGFALLWTVDQALVSAAGLLLAGLGVAMLYPVALAEALAAWPADPDRAAARCALASGLAIGAAPLLLGALADAVGLRTAFLLAPLLLLAVLARSANRLAGAAAARR
jgi:MFS family permease